MSDINITLEQLKSEIKQLHDTYQKMIRNLQFEIYQVQKQRDASTNAIVSLKEDIKESTKLVEELEGAVVGLRRQLESAESRNEDLEKKHLYSSMGAHTAAAVNNTIAANVIETLKEENERLKANLQEIKDRDAQQEGYYWNSMAEIGQVREINKNLCTRINSLVQERSDFQDLINDLNSKLNRLRNERFDLQKEIIHLKDQWKGQCTLVDTLNEKITLKDQTIDQLRKEIMYQVPACCISPSVEGKVLLGKISALEKQVISLTKSRDDLRKNNKKLTEQVTYHDSNYRVMSDQLQNAQMNIKALDHVNKLITGNLPPLEYVAKYRS